MKILTTKCADDSEFSIIYGCLEQMGCDVSDLPLISLSGERQISLRTVFFIHCSTSRKWVSKGGEDGRGGHLPGNTKNPPNVVVT